MIFTRTKLPDSAITTCCPPLAGIVVVVADRWLVPVLQAVTTIATTMSAPVLHME